jgi:hypothetical protein
MYVPSSELGLSNPSLASECAPPPKTGGGEHTHLRVRGWGSLNSDDWGKSLALCLLLCSQLTETPSRRFESTPSPPPPPASVVCTSLLYSVHSCVKY